MTATRSSPARVKTILSLPDATRRSNSENLSCASVVERVVMRFPSRRRVLREPFFLQLASGLV
jgi:hypothetical protein